MLRFPRAVRAAASAAIAFAPSRLWAAAPSGADRDFYGMPMMGWGGGWYAMIFGPLFMILVLALVIAVAVLLVRWLGGPWQTHQPPPARTPLDNLKERFARGEIDEKEFEERRRLLGG